MAKIDVIKAVFDSFELIRRNFREVAFPLLVLLVLSGAGQFTTSYATDSNDLANFLSSSQAGSSVQSSLLASPMDDLPPIVSGMLESPNMLLALGGVILGVLLLLIVLSIIVSIIDRAVWFYVYEFFYSLMTKKKITKNWQARMKRNTVKSFFIHVFWFALLVAIFSIPMLLLLGNLLAGSTGIAVVSLFLLAIIVLVALSFLFMPLWIFYAMDGHGLIDSASRSISLVMGNVVTFLVYAFLFFVIGVGAVMLSIMACCFSFIVTPVVTVFMQLLGGVTLMKIKLAVEKG